MSTGFPELVKRIAGRLGLRIVRVRPLNRFDAIDETLVRMKRLGYDPRVAIDVGANRGRFHEMLREIFPRAHFHLIEPQSACSRSLRDLERRYQGVEVHEVAVTEPGFSSVRLVGEGFLGGSTGAYVAGPDEQGLEGTEVPATTLDSLLSSRISPDHRAFLKLDVEAHELAVLRGAIDVLRKTEVVLAEVSFFDVGNRGNPLFDDILAFMATQGFVLYDIAALAGRAKDARLRMGDVLFVRRGSSLLSDVAWE